MARADGVAGGVTSGCGCGCGDTVGDTVSYSDSYSGSEACGCGCTSHKPQSTMEEISQLQAQRAQIDRRLDELAAS